MDTLKPFEEILLPDIRQNHLLFNRKTGKCRKRKLEDHYSAIKEIELSAAVPEKIREHFETARNLLLYSWFVYRFIHVAELHAFASVEFALREKVKEKRGTTIRSLKQLLDIAIKEGWIKDSRFRNYREAENEQSQQGIPPEIGDDQAEQDMQRYCKLLADTIPHFRNEFAHGSSWLYPGGFTSLAICADLINQLYEQE